MQKILGVNGAERRPAEVLRPGLAHPRDHNLGALGFLESGQQLAVDQLGLAVLQAVVLGTDGQHNVALPINPAAGSIESAVAASGPCGGAAKKLAWEPCGDYLKPSIRERFPRHSTL